VKFNINLASQPYEDARRFYMRWTPVLIVLLLLALFTAGRATVAFRDARKIDRDLRAQERQLQTLNEQKQRAEETLARPENAGTRDRAQFLNELFRRKAFSWTQVLMEVERLMPTGIRLVAIEPTLSEQNELLFTMEVETHQRSRAIELVSRLEQSSRFQDAYIRSETAQDEGQTFTFAIGATYIPERSGQEAR
jgi:type IV pilus assembly protein PilN